MSTLKEYTHKPLSGKTMTIGLVLFFLGVIGVALAFFDEPLRAKFNYLIMFAFLASLAVGSVFLIAIEYIIGSDWSTPIRRIPEFYGKTLIFLLLAAIPLVFFIHDLYHWSHPEAVAADKILKGKSPYLNETFFIIRLFAVILIWMLFHTLFTRNSQKQDETGDQKLTSRNIKLSAPFIMIFAITISIGAIDWMMSLEAHWFSTIFGVYYFAGTMLTGLAFTTITAIYLKKNGYLHPAMKDDTFYSLGTLMFAFTVFWAYIAFSQYMLIWYANLPEETFWLIDRSTGAWANVSIGLIFIHFIFPFLLLLARSTKTNISSLKVASVWLLVAHYYDLYWIVMPTYSKTNPPIGWMEFVFPLIPVGLALIVFSWQSKKKNLVPVKDPKLERGLKFHL
jgi:hypothetical protein